MQAVDADDQALFRALVKRHREARRWSQERLAEEAECDHSLVSRVEAGRRSATRALVGKVATGLELDRAETDALFVAAGYLPPGLGDSPDGATLGLALWRALAGGGLSAEARGALLAAVGGAVRLAAATKGGGR